MALTEEAGAEGAGAARETVLPQQVLATDAAEALIERLRGLHGPVMFHQSGGCCDGSSPMCYPAGAAFGGYKQSGIGRENHKMMLDHYQQTKNVLVSYSPNALGFF